MSYETYEVRVYEYGAKHWYQNGERHRLDGPACEWVNGTKYYYQNDKLHRLDGPACEFSDGDKSYYIEGKQYSEEEFNKKITPPKCNKVVTIDGVEYELKERV
jgi:hypothetical protein